MSSKEEKANLFKLIGLSDHKIEETIKNESLTKLLVEIISHVRYQISYFISYINQVISNLIKRTTNNHPRASQEHLTQFNKT